ncbi:MAG: hypothetical protein A4E42_00539 [Methanoregulaceae archaeon PtaU1.Bin222]|nr:MAG: hypothetical protein A4E42_00539 [Methanoregulaceae archaeon PtaU1.Bin222]
MNIFRKPAEERECAEILPKPCPRGPPVPDDLEEDLLNKEVIRPLHRDERLDSLFTGTLYHRCTEEQVPGIDEHKRHVGGSAPPPAPSHALEER